MKIYFDANFPPNIPLALDKLEKFDQLNEILSTTLSFGQDIKDPKLIKEIAKSKGIWITFDRKALKAHIKVLKRYKVPVFAFEYASQGYWDKTYLTLRHWKKIKEIISENQQANFYSVRVTKTKVIASEVGT